LSVKLLWSFEKTQKVKEFGFLFFIFYGDQVKRESYVISAVKACKMLRKGSIDYWSYALEINNEEIKIEDISMVCEFPEVFSK